MTVAVCALGLAACGSASRASTSDTAHTTTSDGRVADPPTTETPASAVELFSAAELSRIADELSRGASTARTLAAHPEYHYVEARRVRDGTPEVHDDWADVTIVQSGRATLLAGGRVAAARLTSPGEWRGGAISGGTPRAIATGDFFVIPAGVPHQYLVARGDSIRYLTIKVARVRPTR